MAVTRTSRYQWRLREVMATKAMFNASDLVGPLAEHGINLSSVQVWRLVTQTPERLSLPVLAALCDILDVTPAQLIAVKSENVSLRKAATRAGSVTELAPLRPKRARLRPDS
jgi:DNA-binding Xre family transcriptional regulator